MFEQRLVIFALQIDARRAAAPPPGAQPDPEPRRAEAEPDGAHPPEQPRDRVIRAPDEGRQRRPAKAAQPEQPAVIGARAGHRARLPQEGDVVALAMHRAITRALERAHHPGHPPDRGGGVEFEPDRRRAHAALQHVGDHRIPAALDVDLEKVEPGMAEALHDGGDAQAGRLEAVGGGVQVLGEPGLMRGVDRRMEAHRPVGADHAPGMEGDAAVILPRHVVDRGRGGVEAVHLEPAFGQREIEAGIEPDPAAIGHRPRGHVRRQMPAAMRRAEPDQPRARGPQPGGDMEPRQPAVEIAPDPAGEHLQAHVRLPSAPAASGAPGNSIRFSPRTTMSAFA